MGWGGNTTGTIENELAGGPDGPDDGYLKTSVTNFHVGAKNTEDWSGDYLAAGVLAIEMDLNRLPVLAPSNPGETDEDPNIQIRILIFGPGGTFASKNRTPDLETNNWSHHRFDLTPDELVYVKDGTGVLDVHHMLAQHLE